MVDKQDLDVVHDENDKSVSSPPSDPVRTRRLVRAIDLRLLPLCAWVYLLNYLDRGNIGNSRVLNQETGDSFIQKLDITQTQYAIVLSLFSIAYGLFEVPSNWIMKRYVRPSLWLAVLLFGWSAFTLGFTGVHTYPQVVVLRFLIGAFEAGFFPGIVYITTFWYRPEERSVRIAFVMASATLAGAFGGCIAYGMGKMNGIGGLEGFRWLFLIEGLISVLSCLLIIFFLPDWPERSWLSVDDAKFATERLEGQGYTKAHASRREIMETCLSPRMLAHYFTYVSPVLIVQSSPPKQPQVLDCIPLGSLTFYTPTIVAGLGYSSITAQLMTVPPWVVGYVVSLSLSWSADRLNARGWHIAFSSTVGGIGWLTAGLLPTDAYTKRYGALILCACGAFPSAAPLSAWVTCNVPSIATMGIAAAINNSGAGISQIVAQWIWRTQEASENYPTGNFVCAACSFATAVMAIGLRVWYGRLNARAAKDASGRERVWLY